MKLSTARRIASSQDIDFVGVVTKAQYEEIKKVQVRTAENIIKKANKKERQARTLARRRSKAWRKRKHG